jgi:transposase
VDDRRSIGGIIHVLRIGWRRKDGPPADGSSTPVCNRFNRWSHRSLWGRFFAALAAQAELPDGLKVDSTAGRTRRPAQGRKAGRESGPSCARLAVQPAKSMP